MYYYVYILQNKKDNTFYTGLTGDLRKRLKEHNENKSTRTKGRGLFTLSYYETCLNKTDARSREIYLKSGMGKRFIKDRLKRFLSLTG
ncbi:MAG: GIY-YIG nuclease family protein [Candidatus Paceibacterota bacterium]|jgi:putative endonuclease